MTLPLTIGWGRHPLLVPSPAPSESGCRDGDESVVFAGFVLGAVVFGSDNLEVFVELDVDLGTVL
jgi:hypothetical protein